MMKKIFTSMLCAGLAWTVQAIELGDIVVYSRANQPLDAEVEVLDSQSLQENEIVATLASPEEFRRSGYELAPLLSQIHIGTDSKMGGNKVIRLSSTQAIKSSAVNLVLEVNSSKGHVIKPYSISLAKGAQEATTQVTDGIEKLSSTGSFGLNPDKQQPASESSVKTLIATMKVLQEQTKAAQEELVRLRVLVETLQTQQAPVIKDGAEVAQVKLGLEELKQTLQASNSRAPQAQGYLSQLWVTWALLGLLLLNLMLGLWQLYHRLYKSGVPQALPIKPAHPTQTPSDKEKTVAPNDWNYIAGHDPVATKLDLARVYIDMGEKENAKLLLQQAINDGNDQQKREAKTLFERV